MSSKSKSQWSTQTKTNEHSWILCRKIINKLAQYNKDTMQIPINHILYRWRIPYIERHRIHFFAYLLMTKNIFIQHEHSISAYFGKEFSFNRDSISVDTSKNISLTLPDTGPVILAYNMTFTILSQSFYKNMIKPVMK